MRPRRPMTAIRRTGVETPVAPAARAAARTGPTRSRFPTKLFRKLTGGATGCGQDIERHRYRDLEQVLAAQSGHRTYVNPTSDSLIRDGHLSDLHWVRNSIRGDC